MFYSDKTTSSAVPHPEDIESIMTQESLHYISTGAIPDLRDLCSSLLLHVRTSAEPSALDFVSQFAAVPEINGISGFPNTENNSVVLLHHEGLKIVLIGWKPGKETNVHGHPAGGCLFKVLKGSLEESRFSANSSQLLAESNYQTGSIAYIDDRLGFHTVRNQSSDQAISLHAYTDGGKSETIMTINK